MSEYIYFLPFFALPTFDVEKMLDIASKKWKQDFHLIKTDDMYIVSSGAHQLILALQNEHLSMGIVDTLISSYPQWSYEEISQLREHQVLISIRSPKTLFKSKQHMSLIASVVLALLEQEGAVGLFDAKAEKYYPVSYFQKYNGETIPKLDEVDFLFTGKQNKKR
jgi:hypothetical protein